MRWTSWPGPPISWWLLPPVRGCSCSMRAVGGRRRGGDPLGAQRLVAVPGPVPGSSGGTSCGGTASATGARSGSTSSAPTSTSPCRACSGICRPRRPTNSSKTSSRRCAHPTPSTRLTWPRRRTPHQTGSRDRADGRVTVTPQTASVTGGRQNPGMGRSRAAARTSHASRRCGRGSLPGVCAGLGCCVQIVRVCERARDPSGRVPALWCAAGQPITVRAEGADSTRTVVFAGTERTSPSSW